MDDFAGADGLAGDPVIGAESDGVHAGCDAAVELVRGGVVNENGGALAADDFQGGGLDFLKQGHELGGRAEFAAETKDGPQIGDAILRNDRRGFFSLCGRRCHVNVIRAARISAPAHRRTV